jgi:hypothetical protein
LLDRPVDLLFGEYADAFARGERPRAAEYLSRAGDDGDELAGMIDRFLRAAPRREATVEDSVRLVGWLQSDPPLVELRRRRGVKREEVVEGLLRAHGLKPASRERMRDAYHELETGQLDPAGVAPSVWSALADILKANVRDLAGWRLPPAAPSPTYFRANEMSLERRLVIRHDSDAAGDEIDRLFRAGS